jgi:hypothetical protein
MAIYVVGLRAFGYYDPQIKFGDVTMLRLEYVAS